MAKVIRKFKKLHGEIAVGLLETELSWKAKFLWGVLDSFGESIFAKRKTIALRMSVSIDTVDKGVKELEKAGWLEKESGQKKGERSEYILLIPGLEIDEEGTAHSGTPAADSGTQVPPTAAPILLSTEQASTEPIKTSHQAIVESHQVAFIARHGIKPDYKPSDFKAVKDYLDRGQTLESFRGVLANFMAAPPKFTAGHSLKKACDNWQAYLEGEHGQLAGSDKRISHSQERSTLSGSDPLAPKP